MSTERGIAYGGRPLWQRSPRSSPSRGKPGTWRRRAGGFDGIRQGGLHNARHRNCTERHQQKSRLNHWRAGCGESRMSGSEGGRRKSAPITRSNSPAAYPTRGRAADGQAVRQPGARRPRQAAYSGGPVRTPSRSYAGPGSDGSFHRHAPANGHSDARCHGRAHRDLYAGANRHRHANSNRHRYASANCHRYADANR